MPIIHIYGASGSGVSTLGKALQEHYNYLQLDIDNYYWLPTQIPFTQKGLSKTAQITKSR